ncbi:primosomal protein DnaI [Aquibacillus salsiterrae]|uniref:Primosomal protein DnaI n=1 Tax=Aquibacillus salsiterrae TaxID=2950439 RepID=A0A9X4ADN6_9BACI|nr:primosomal protein DnaI [Aquibacillus salsiterrae]MDC3415732.1 primosomal protein DnaI [Aquibacillus salsiterrae]
MEPIQSSLKKWMRENSNFYESYNQIRRETVSDKYVKAILDNHPEFTEQDIDKNLMKLYEFKSQSKKCENCPSLEGCINILKGYSPYIEISGKDVHLTYEQCNRKRKADEQKSKHSLVQGLYMPKDILEASLNGLDYQDPDRHEAISKALDYVQSIDTGKKQKKGLYFYGPFGVGKTYILGAIANELADHKLKTLLIYMPEFVREMKSSLKDDSINQKIDYFKKADVLMFDDIGAESISSWFRDEILGSILQYRMMERLPVFFSSNYSIKQLEHHLATTNRGDTETVKAGRIIERIKQVSTEVPLFGQNRREFI